MAIDYTVLKTELNDDPKGLGLTSLNDRLAAEKLNKVGASNQEIDVLTVSPINAQKSVIGTEFDVLSAGKQRLWLAILSTGSIEIRNFNIRGQIGSIWGAGTVTKTNLVALQKRSASRSEVLFGPGVKVSQNDVDAGRKL